MSEYTRKPRSSRHNKKHMPRILLVLCLMLVVMVGSIAGTVAWLTDKTDEVKNTFTTADIKISLTETENVKDGAWSAQLVPGKEYGKNPIVKVESDTDVDIYLFVKVDDTVSQYLSYTNNLTAEGSGWTKLSETENVWFRTVKTTDSTKEWPLIGDNKVTVKDSIVKQGTDVTGTTNIVMPDDNTDLHLTYTAYAIQMEGSTSAVDAWAKLNPSTTVTD